MRFVDTQGEEENEGKKQVLTIVAILQYLELLHCELKHTCFYYQEILLRIVEKLGGC